MDLTPQIIVSHGAKVGLVVDVRAHPNAQHIRLSYVDLGDGCWPAQIVFGGCYQVQADDLVPVAPPGSWVFIERIPMSAPKAKKMRSRRYRGMRSHGMLCSLNELGWAFDGPDEVATLRDVVPGEGLDGLSYDERLDRVERHRSRVVPPMPELPVQPSTGHGSLQWTHTGQTVTK
jgi:tRNA-binding EMAP/Myf-like protein